MRFHKGNQTYSYPKIPSNTFQPVLSNQPITPNKHPFEKFDAVEGIGNLDAETTTEEPGVAHIVLKRPDTIVLHATVEQGYALRGAYTEAIAKQFNSSDGKTSIYDMHVTAVEEMGKNEEKDNAEAENEPEGRDCAKKKQIYTNTETRIHSHQETVLTSKQCKGYRTRSCSYAVTLLVLYGCFSIHNGTFSKYVLNVARRTGACCSP